MIKNYFLCTYFYRGDTMDIIIGCLLVVLFWLINKMETAKNEVK